MDDLSFMKILLARKPLLPFQTANYSLGKWPIEQEKGMCYSIVVFLAHHIKPKGRIERGLDGCYPINKEIIVSMGLVNQCFNF